MYRLFLVNTTKHAVALNVVYQIIIPRLHPVHSLYLNQIMFLTKYLIACWGVKRKRSIDNAYNVALRQSTLFFLGTEVGMTSISTWYVSGPCHYYLHCLRLLILTTFRVEVKGPAGRAAIILTSATTNSRKRYEYWAACEHSQSCYQGFCVLGTTLIRIVVYYP